MARSRLQDLFSGQSNATASSTRSTAARTTPTARTNMASYLTQNPGEDAGGKRENVNRALGASIQEAQRIQQETDARREQQLSYLQTEQGLASQPTMTSQDIERMYSQQTDRIGADTQALVKNLREYLGSSGIQGNAALDMAGQIEVQRLAQERDARRDLHIFRANADATDRLNRWARAFQIGDVIGKEPSPFLSDAIQALAGVRLTQQGLGVAYDTAQMQARAAENAGNQAFAGNLIGAGVSLAGTALFG